MIMKQNAINFIFSNNNITYNNVLKKNSRFWESKSFLEVF